MDGLVRQDLRCKDAALLHQLEADEFSTMRIFILSALCVFGFFTCAEVYDPGKWMLASAAPATGHVSSPATFQITCFQLAVSYCEALEETSTPGCLEDLGHALREDVTRMERDAGPDLAPPRLQIDLSDECPAHIKPAECARVVAFLNGEC